MCTSLCMRMRACMCVYVWQMPLNTTCRVHVVVMRACVRAGGRACTSVYVYDQVCVYACVRV